MQIKLIVVVVVVQVKELITKELAPINLQTKDFNNNNKKKRIERDKSANYLSNKNDEAN